MLPSSRTPEGEPNRCPICGADLILDPSFPAGDAPCPSCGCLLWFQSGSILDLDFFVPLAYLSEIGHCTKQVALEKMIDALVDAEVLPAEAKSDIVGSLLKREELGSTGIGRGIAVPHAKCSQTERVIGCVARSTAGIEFVSPDGEPVHLLVLLLSPPNCSGDHLRALEKVSKWLRRQPAVG